MKQEILVKLRSAEDDTAKRVAAAKGRAAEIQKQARSEAQRLLEAAEAEARKDEEARLVAERKKLESERARLLDQGKKQEETARAAYARKVDAHVQKALATLEKAL